MRVALLITVLALAGCEASSSGNTSATDKVKNNDATQLAYEGIIGRYNIFEKFPQYEGNFSFFEGNFDRNGQEYCQIVTIDSDVAQNKLSLKLNQCDSEGNSIDDKLITLTSINNETIVIDGWNGGERQLFPCEPYPTQD